MKGSCSPQVSALVETAVGWASGSDACAHHPGTWLLEGLSDLQDAPAHTVSFSLQKLAFKKGLQPGASLDSGRKALLSLRSMSHSPVS